MATRVGDLYPFSSGTSSLGVEMTNGSPTRDIVPFNAIHVNSGIFHNVNGGSGVLRYGAVNKVIEYSNDGGITFSPLSISMQAAYDGGNEISSDKIGGISRGVVFKDRSRSLLYPTWFDLSNKDFAIAVSGFALDQNDPNRAHLLRIASNGILVRGSGVDISQQTPSELFMGYLNDGPGGINSQNSVPIILGSGALGLYVIAVNGLSMAVPDGPSVMNFGGGVAIGVEGNVTLDNGGGDFVIDISAGQTLTLDCDTGDVTSRPFQNFQFDAFNGSGRLTYRFGPHEGWAWKPSYASTGGTANDGFFPIPHSGQIQSMIKLQTAYENDNAVLTTTAQGGPLSINGSGTAALFLSVSPSGGVHLSLSGVPNSPSSFSNVGDLFLANHSYNLGDPFLVSVTPGALQASSPGLPTLWLHAGSSGIVSIRTGSGIMQCFNTVASPSVSGAGFFVSIPVIGQTNPDRYYRPVPNSSGIRIDVEGLYRITYTVSLLKTIGTSGQQCNTELRLFDLVRDQYRILGSQSYAQVFDADSLNRNTANGQAVLDLNANEIVGLFVQASVDPTPNDAFIIPSRAANIIFEYLGPMRGNTSTRDLIT